MNLLIIHQKLKLNALNLNKSEQSVVQGEWMHETAGRESGADEPLDVSLESFTKTALQGRFEGDVE